ncbi:MAG: restriction endonuclease [Candidatus Dadabacteria bacterium]|nr:restriction endonuclease [Candidatus Dadabacteria bacterium]MDE0477288.1 restriction endonuclease [Candidatus Dadabacteria bacterium]
MSEVITVIEHESVPIVRSRAGGQKGLEEKHADLLEKLEGEIPSKAFSWGHREVKFASYCGVISLGDISIEILPKIYGIEADDAGSSRKALVHMLYRAQRMKLHETGTAKIDLQKRFLLDIFILHFCKLLRAQMTRGMIRKYVSRKENLKVLRGKLEIGEHIKQNLVHKERMFCQYDELSADNLYNRILKCVLAIMLKEAKGNHTLRQVSELLGRFDAISDCAADAVMLDQLIFDRLNERYKPVFDQCRYFLDGLFPNVITGKKDCLTLLFDMNRLFEEYVGSQLRKEGRVQGIRTREQGPLKYFARLENSDEKVFGMKPDFSFINRKNQIVMIADAKWKILDEGEKNLAISQTDMYQMGSYASRYGVTSLALLYPMQKNLTERVKIALLGEIGTTLHVVPIDIRKEKQDEMLPLS